MKALLKTGELEAELFVPLGVERRWLHLRPAYVRIRQHTSAYVSRRRECSFHSGLRVDVFTSVLHTSAYVSMRPHTSAYVRIRQHTSAYVSIRQEETELVVPRGVERGDVLTSVLY